VRPGMSRHHGDPRCAPPQTRGRRGANRGERSRTGSKTGLALVVSATAAAAAVGVLVRVPRCGADARAWLVPPLRLGGFGSLRGRGLGPLRYSIDRDDFEAEEFFEMPAAFLGEELEEAIGELSPDGLAEDLGGATVVEFGKHKGKTYEEVLHDDPSYCTWCSSRSLFDCSSAGLAFSAWLFTQDVPEVILSGSCKIQFGKHAGKTYEDVRQTDPGYCHFVMSLSGHGSGDGVNNFADWLADQEIPEANATTLVGFGKYSDKTYEAVLFLDPDYCVFVQKRQAEGPKTAGDNNLFKDFAGWLSKLPEDHKPQCCAEEGRIQFGRYSGETFEKVLETDPVYCGLVLDSAETSPVIFVKWLQDRRIKPPPPEQSKVREVTEGNLTFGRYRGKTFQEVLSTKPDYCQCILQTVKDQVAPVLGMVHFAQWLTSQGVQLRSAAAALP